MPNFLQVIKELTPEFARQNLNRHEEFLSGIDEPQPVVGKSACGYNTVNMRMIMQILSPGVQYGCNVRQCAQMLGIVGKFKDSISGSFHKHRIKKGVVLIDDCIQFMRESKNKMEIAYRQKPFQLCFNPFLLP
jgi:hypothetical protein